MAGGAGEDIDGVSRATITNDAAVHSIRDSARRMAREFIAERRRPLRRRQALEPKARWAFRLTG